jgi:anthranilate synthase component 1
MHIASRVTGKMVPGKTCVDVLRATFPAGTVSGAPKIRAMEIIDELESSRRTIYAGGVGYFDFSGNMDFCIAIRTLFAKGSKLYFQAGAGIVADSDPAREFEETLNKSRVIVDAIKLAQEIS